MTEKLKPCPFCGENEQEVDMNIDYDWYVRCQYCGACAGFSGKKDYAIADWNRRKEGGDDTNKS